VRAGSGEVDPFMLSREERVRNGRKGGLKKSHLYDPAEYIKPARAAFMARFEPKDPDLSPQERERRARVGLRLHMLELSERAAKVRALRKRSR
jgi:hypothetical protein